MKIQSWRVPILLFVEAVIIVLLLVLPASEWLNILVSLFMVLLAYLLWWWMKRVVYSRFEQTHPLFKHLPWKKIAIGVMLGIGTVLLIIGLIWIFNGFSEGSGYKSFATANPEIVARRSPANTATRYMKNIGSALLIYAHSALGEELLFRVVGMGLPVMLVFWLVFGRKKRTDALGTDKKKAWRTWLLIGTIANVLVAVAFGLFHSGSPGWTVVPMLNITLSGLLYGQLFVLQGNLLGAWAMHWLWNVTQAALGLPVSGRLAADGPLVAVGFQGARDGILSGGQYGPEGSIIAVVVQAVILVALVKIAWQSVRPQRRIENGEKRS